MPYDAAMPKTGSKKESRVVYVRAVPQEVSNRLKAAAALEGKTLQVYLMELLKRHVTELEKKGLLPKGK